MTTKRERSAGGVPRTPFYVGQPADDVVQVCNRTGRLMVGDPEVLDDEEREGTKIPALTVRWRLTCGAALTLRKFRWPDEKGALRYRVSEIAFEENG